MYILNIRGKLAACNITHHNNAQIIKNDLKRVCFLAIV